MKRNRLNRKKKECFCTGKNERKWKKCEEKQDNEKLQPSVCMSIFVLVCKMSQGRLGVYPFYCNIKTLPPYIYFIIQRMKKQTNHPIPQQVSQEMQRKRKRRQEKEKKNKFSGSRKRNECRDKSCYVQR